MRVCVRMDARHPVWPMAVHVGAQRRARRGEGPAALVLAPTRELAEQIFREARKSLSAVGCAGPRAVCMCVRVGRGQRKRAKHDLPYGNNAFFPVCLPARVCSRVRVRRRAVAVLGGAGKWEMTCALKEGCETVVATPGRLMELVKSKATSLSRVTFLVRWRSIGTVPLLSCFTPFASSSR